MTNRVPLMELSWDAREVDAAIEVLKGGMVTQGCRVRELESKFQHYVHDSKECVMVNSGSSANFLALRLLREMVNDSFPRLKGRGEVITTPVTWATTVSPIIQMGFTPVFVDVGPDAQLDASKVEAAIGANTVAILPVHVMGYAADITRLSRIARDNRIFLVEDCCEALGVLNDGYHVGSFADVSTYSFYLNHLLTTIEGGMVLAHEQHYKLRAWREHGWTRAYPPAAAKRAKDVDEYLDHRWVFDELGWNLRSTDVQAAIGLVQLEKQPEFKLARKRIEAEYRKGILAPWMLPLPERAGVDANPFCHVRLLREDAPITRQAFQNALELEGIETRPIISGNITRHPWYRRNTDAYRVSGSLETADAFHERGLLIPIHPTMSNETIHSVISLVNRVGGADSTWD